MCSLSEAKKLRKTSELHTWVEPLEFDPFFGHMFQQVQVAVSVKSFFFVFTSKEANFHFTLFQTQL
jgi:hypothetical protein